MDEPTSVVPWASGNVRLLTDARGWPEVDRPRRIGVSGFGISGTNAHIILEQAPASETPRAVTASGPVPLVLSARSRDALIARGHDLATHIERSHDPDLAAVAGALTSTRTHFEERAVVVAADVESAVRGLRDLPATGRAIVDPRPVFVFPGQGAQWAGMGLDLLETSEVFASRFAECDAALREHTDCSVHDGLRAGSNARVNVVQPALFAMMVSLAELWRAHGVEPTAVIGHSQGEIAAAVVSGALTLADGARIAAVRSAALLDVAGDGSMAAIAAPEDAVRSLIADAAPTVEIAGLNGPTSIVVSGPSDAVAALHAAAADRQIRSWIIDVDYASHSSSMDRLRERIVRDIGTVTPAASATALISSVTGEVTDPSALTAAYWFDNLRRPVLLEAATRTALARRHRVFLEVSPHPVLGVALLSTLDAAGHGDGAPSPAAVLATLHRDGGTTTDWLDALGGAYRAGVHVGWDRLVQPSESDLPVYPFQHRRFWYNAPRATGPGDTESTATVDPLADLAAPIVQTDASEAADLRARLVRLDPSLAQRQVTTIVLEALASALGHESASALSPDRSFLDLGVSSLAAVAVRTRLADRTGLALPVTVVFDHPNPAALAEFITDEIASETIHSTDAGRSTDAGTADGPRTSNAAVAAEIPDLTDATDDEMFAALDRELGMT